LFFSSFLVYKNFFVTCVVCHLWTLKKKRNTLQCSHSLIIFYRLIFHGNKCRIYMKNWLILLKVSLWGLRKQTKLEISRGECRYHIINSKIIS
jgi:hypothetical protein